MAERVPVLQRTGGRFLCSKALAKSRSNLEIFLLIPKHVHGRNLLDLIDNAVVAKQQIYLAIDTCSSLRRELQTDSNVTSNFRIFVQTMLPPMDLLNIKHRHWIARVLLPHLILSASKFAWRGAAVGLLFRHSKCSLMSTILKYCWNEIKNEVSTDVNLLLEHPEHFFCNTCNPQCPLYRMDAHFQLSQFDELEPSADLVNHAIFTSIRFFGCAVPSGDPKLLFLHQRHSRIAVFSQTQVAEVFREISANYIESLTEPHCCYMLCVLQSDSMESTEDEEEEEESLDRTEIERLINDISVNKFLYVGVTTGTDYRRGHIRQTNSSVHRLLSKHARMFVLRKFITNSRVEAERNEAFVIELLKTIVTKKVQTRLPLPFQLVNKNSGPASLLGLDEEYINGILDFVDSEKQVFTATSTTLNVTNSPEFTGEYSFLTETSITTPTIMEKEYRDVSKDVEQVLSRNKNARWSDFR